MTEEIKIESNDVIELKKEREFVKEDIFDAHFFGTKLRCSIVTYVCLAVALLGFLLPYFSMTLQTRNTSDAQTNAIKSEKTGLYWNEEGSTGLQVALGRTIPYVENVKNVTVRMPLTDGVFEGMATRDTRTYLSFGSILFCFVPILIIYAAIFIASRAQWQKGGGFLATLITTGIALAFKFIVLFNMAGYFDFGSGLSALKLSARFWEIFAHLGIGFYVMLVGLVCAILVSLYAYGQLKSGKCYKTRVVSTETEEVEA